MDTALLLLLPLVGGYFFVKNCILTSYEVARESGHRLYFRAIFVGFALVFVALVLHVALISWAPYASVQQLAADITAPLFDGTEPRISDLATVCIVALLLGVVGWRPLNWILPRDPFLERAVRDHGVEKLLLDALRRGISVAVTMENRKVYVGFLTTTVDPLQTRRTVSLLPIRSGYRDNQDGTLKFTTNYDRLFTESLDKRLDHLALEDFEIILPTDRIQSIRRFDLKAYAEFEALNAAEQPA